MREDRIRCDHELKIDGMKVILMSTTNIHMQKYNGTTGSLVLNDNIEHDAVKIVFIAPEAYANGFMTSYLVEVFESENTITFTTSNSTYIFKKETNV